MPTAVPHGSVNAVLWFTSLRPDEQGVTRRILDDLVPYLDSVRIHHQVFEVTTAGQFLATLEALAVETAAGTLKPILHLDMHGSAEDGLRIAASGEIVPWDALADSLSAINATLQNNLFVVSCACHGQRFISATKLLRTCPYYVLVAPRERVTAGFLEGTIVPFYQAIFDEEDFVSAYRLHLVSEFSLFHSERLLFLALVKYVRGYCIGRGAAERREDLMSQAVVAGLLPSPDLRRAIRDGIAADQAIVDNFASVFLAGKPPHFRFEDVMESVRQLVEQEQRQVGRLPS